MGGDAVVDRCAIAEPGDSEDFDFEEHPVRTSKTIASGTANIIALNVKIEIFGDILSL